MGKSKSKKKKKQTTELIIFLILLLISAGLIMAMISLYQQRKNPSFAETPIPPPPQQETIATVPVDPSETIILEDAAETMPAVADTAPVDESASLVDQTMQNMTLDQKIYQLFIVTPEMLVNNAVSVVVQTGDMSKQAIQEKPVSGLVYFSQNFESADQTKEMISAIQDCAKEQNSIGLWIAVDEEGGSVARVADTLGTTAYEPMAAFGERHEKTEVFDMASDIAADISELGFNLDFAPVADVNLNPENELQDRIFSDDPLVVADMVSAMVQGLQNSGQVCATLKHFPGLGAESGNTHDDSVITIDRTLEELQSAEFPPFQSGIQAGAEWVMVGHQVMSCAGDNLPSDLSETVINGWLRQNLGFTGIVITDAQYMHTITDNYSSGEAALRSIQAGADIVLMPANLDEAFQSIKSAVEDGSLSEERIDESVRRILTVKAKHNLL